METEASRLILIDYRDRRPIYEQIVDRFQLLILKEVLKEDEQMPPVRKLAAEMAVNPNTIQKAYRILEQQGYIYPVKGKGNFVSGYKNLLEKKREEYWKEYRLVVDKGLQLGILMDEFVMEMQRLVRKGETT